MQQATDANDGGAQAETLGSPELTQLAAENALLRARIAKLETALDDSLESALQLSETERRYAELLRISPHGVLIQEDGRIRYINDRGLQILGARQPSEVISRQPKEFVVPEDEAAFWQRDVELQSKGATAPARLGLVRLDGQRVDIEVNSVLLKRGERYGVLTVFQDVTERVEAERAALEFAERYRIINELGGDYIYLDSIGADGRVTPLWVTDAFTRITGYTFEEALQPELLMQLLHPEDATGFMAHVALLLSGEPVDHVTRIITKEGAIRWVRHIARPIFDQTAGRVTLLYGSVRDVTESHVTRVLLRHNEERLREAQRIAGVGSWEVDLATGQLTWSDECYRIFGQDPALFYPTNEAFFTTVHPDDLQRVQAASRVSRETGQLYEIEHRIVRPDGEVRHVHERAELRLGPDGAPSLMFGTVLDITERVMAERELQQAYLAMQHTNTLLKEEVAERRRVEDQAREFADRYEMISELSDEFIGLSSVTPDGELVFQWLTDSFERMTGYTLEDTRQPGFLAALAPASSHPIQHEHFGRALNNEPNTVEGELLTKSGRVLWIRSTLRPIWSDAEGRVTHIYGCVRDITQQRKSAEELHEAYAALEEINHQLEEEMGDRLLAEHSLRDSESRYRELVESMGEGLLMTDLEERILYANPVAERIFGLPRGGLNGHSLNEFVDEHTFSLIRSESVRRQRGQPSVYEFEIDRADGERRRLRASVSPLRNPAGHVTATMGVLADVTEQEQLRSRLQEEQREESIIMLAGGIAHDFNNMLMGVMGAAALLETHLTDPDETTIELTEAIRTSAERMKDLTNKLLAYARGGKYQTRIIHLNDAVRNASLMLRGNIPSRVSIDLDLADSLWPVEADAGQIEQVLLNLCVNAFEAIESAGEGGMVRISTSNENTGHIHPRPPRLPQSRLCVRVSVVDTGGGMTPETLERVFEPFFSTKFHGRGLGLAASSGIVRSHGGVIWAESTPGQGTAFHILLPAAHRQEDHHEATLLTAMPENARVLIVDDDASALDIVKRMLENLGFEVLVATTGADGLATYRKYGHDLNLVITDMRMTDMTGTELVRQIRTIDPAARVLISSGHTAEDALYELGNLRINGFLAKPFSPHELTQALSAALAETTSAQHDTPHPAA